MEMEIRNKRDYTDARATKHFLNIIIYSLFLRRRRATMYSTHIYYMIFLYF
nr:MAG TPA_asm: hypothetical protein [Caudoviricetes sp.]DAN90817.1 MAG TPA: hypothetical protein [Bacteriophage sp.]DAZ57129.1 MAG TPA: hypothetical protein [Caudoviricetes sp.]